jgi:hypothetical protein
MVYKLITGRKAVLPDSVPDMALPKLAGDVPTAPTKIPAPRLEPAFLTAWKYAKLPPDVPAPESEYRFHRTRKWRFDFAWPGQKVAVEMEGGVFTGGAHTRGGHYQSDCEKYNSAVLLGWRILRYTTADVRKRPIQIVREVLQLLEGTGDA